MKTVAPATASFRAFPRFNRELDREITGVKVRLSQRHLPLFASSSLPDRIARELAKDGAMQAKELFESFEFFERTRRRLRAPVVADYCAGHGLVGMLFAAFERQVERVVLVDGRRPDAQPRVFDAVCRVMPWLRSKVEYRELDLPRCALALPAGCSVVAVHACGQASDWAIGAAIGSQGAVALMPCCYVQAPSAPPHWLSGAVGVELAIDIQRSQRLEAAGYELCWSAIPRTITPKNRILLAAPARPD